MPASERRAASAAIRREVLELPEVAQARTVHLYWSVREEVDTHALADALVRRGCRVVLPAVRPGGALEHRRYEGAHRLQPGSFGTFEPVSTETIPPARLDLVLVPALAVDRRGVRLGYGGGYYDRLLAATPAAAAGLVFEACLAEALPAEPHDVRLDAVVTERGVVLP